LRSLLMIHPFLVDCAWRNRNLSTPWPPILGESKGKLRDTLRLPAGSILHLFCHSRGGGNPGNKRVPFQGSPFNPPGPNLGGKKREAEDTLRLPAGSILHLFCHSRGGGNPGNKRVPFQGSPFNPPAPNLWGRTRMGPRDTFGLPAEGLRSSAHLCLGLSSIVPSGGWLCTSQRRPAVG